MIEQKWVVTTYPDRPERDRTAEVRDNPCVHAELHQQSVKAQEGTVSRTSSHSAVKHEKHRYISSHAARLTCRLTLTTTYLASAPLGASPTWTVWRAPPPAWATRCSRLHLTMRLDVYYAHMLRARKQSGMSAANRLQPCLRWVLTFGHNARQTSRSG